MTANPALGVFLHAIGGLAAASFYVPNKRVKGWTWEGYWLTQGIVSWIIAPIVGGLITIPALWTVISGAPPTNLFWSYFFGFLWGIGGLTFGLSMRYLGLSLGYALALGFTMAFGTIVPPLVEGDPAKLLTAGGLITLGGVAVALAGVAVSCFAATLKDKELTTAEKRAAIVEFALTKGVGVAIFSGIMSACMAYGLDAGKPIAAAAVKAGADDLYKNNAVLVVVLLGGFTSNCIWCLYLMARNRGKNKPEEKPTPLPNFLLAALGGTLWYLQFFFYGMGTTRLGQYNFASWTIHMSFIIVFSTLWGFAFKEWSGVSKRTLWTVIGGIAVLIASTAVIGYGNWIAASK